MSDMVERRLRPLYELLDIGNNKKVVTETDKLMKKQPGFPCAKLLKALALVRMNKPDDARGILKEMEKDVPVDPASVQAFSMCYRELDDPVALCSSLESACKKEASEELLALCCMAQVRISEFQKQHRTALTLYKTFNNPVYFGWAVQSLLLNHESMNPVVSGSTNEGGGDDGVTTPASSPGPNSILLQLAERMCEKFLTDQQQISSKTEDSMLYLYLEVLSKLEKWEKLLEFIQTNLFPLRLWDNHHTYGIYCKSMFKLGRGDELFMYLKARFLEISEDYAALKEIITFFGATKQQEILGFLDLLREKYPNRSVGLCSLHFYHNYLNEELQHKYMQRIVEDFEMVIKFGSTKLSFCSDMTEYYKLIKDDSVKRLLLDALNLAKCESDGNYDQYGKIITDVNYETLLRDVLQSSNDPHERMKRANRCFGKFLVCEDAVEKIRHCYSAAEEKNNVRSMESDFHDQFNIIAASSLIAEYFYKSSTKKESEVEEEVLNASVVEKWTDTQSYPKEVSEMQEKMTEEWRHKHKHALKDQGNDIGSLSLEEFKLKCGISSENDLKSCKQPSLLILAVIILEYGIKCSPHNVSMRILLSKLYQKLGATDASYSVLESINLKQVQWDSLGYLIVFETLTHGTYQNADDMLESADYMYGGFKREGMEHVIGAYKCGAFPKVKEFLEFRKQLLNSTNCGLIFCEKRLRDYVTSAQNFGDLKRFSEHVGRQLTSISENILLRNSPFTDNRDFSVLQGLDEGILEGDLDSYREKSHACDTHFYKIRITLLFILTKLIRHTENMGNANERSEVLSLLKLFEERIEEWNNVKHNLEEKVHKNPLLCGILPSTCHKYINLGCADALRKVFGYVRSLLEAEDIGNLSMEEYPRAVEEGFKLVMKRIAVTLNADAEDAAFPLWEADLAEVFFGLHYAVETLSFFRIILECAIKMDKHRMDLWKNDAKNRKSGAAELANHRKMYSTWIKHLTDQVEGIKNIIRKFQSKLSSMELEYHKWNESFEAHLQPATFAHLYPVYCHLVAIRLDSSHKNQTEEIMKVAQGLTDRLKAIKL